MNKKILAVLLGLVFVGSVVWLVTAFDGCSLDRFTGGAELDYGENQHLDPNINSWEQIDPDDEDVDIEWWVDATSWDFYQIASLIYQRTGVRVNFTTALTADGSELSTMIAGNRLPDVITITDYSTRVQLAEEGYVYSLSRLAEYHAPSLLRRMPQELIDFYAGSSGEVYGLANNFYADEDIEAYEALGGSILSNYAIVVRKDYLNAYLDHMAATDPTFDPDVHTTTPSGFIDMALWVKEHYNLSNAHPTVILSEFLSKGFNGSISTALSGLMEYFNVPKEDAEGNLVYEYATEEFQEVLLFLNELYNKRLMISSNFGFSTTNIITHINNGHPFAVIGATHNYSMGFAARSASGYNPTTQTFSDSHEYVPIVITNARGEAPIMLDLSGRGLRVSMITNNANRPDRIIKVMDYLMSEQGQREIYYGQTEGQYYNFLVEPGGTRTVQVDGIDVERTYPYGLIEWTEAAKTLLGAPSGAGWYNAGIKQISILQNPLYVALTSVHGAEMDTYQFYIRYNQKAALIPYTHSRLPFRYPLDTSNLRLYNEMTDMQADLERIWIEFLPSIIMAPGQEAALNLYENALTRARNRGYERWLEYQNESYQANKTAMGITYGWPLNDPNYEAPPVRLRGFYEDYFIPVPDYININ